jgi:hypothetical protein
MSIKTTKQGCPHQLFILPFRNVRSTVLFIESFAKAKVDDIDELLILPNHKVGRLDISVQESLGVHRLETFKDLRHYLQAGPDIEHVFMLLEELLRLLFSYFEAFAKHLHAHQVLLGEFEVLVDLGVALEAL